MPAAPVATTTAAPSSGNSNETTTTAAGQPTTTTTPEIPGGRRKRSTAGSDPASYASETVGPVTITEYQKLNVFEVIYLFSKVHV